MTVDVKTEAKLDEGYHLGVREGDTARREDCDMHRRSRTLVRNDTSLIEGSRGF